MMRRAAGGGRVESRIERRPAARVAFAAALLIATATAVQAQGRWADPYRNGVKAYEAGKCAEAIPLIERAVAVDPKAEANKRIEGVFRLDYFPYYYLALCYADQQQWDKAAQNLDKARPTLTRQQQPKFTETESKIKLALNAPKVDPRKAAFDAALAQAQSALSNRQYQQAISQFDALRSSYAAEYASAGAASKRDEAVRGYAGQLADEGRQLLQQNKLNEAKSKLQLADQTLGGQKPVADALGEIRRREDEYQRLKASAQNDVNAKNYSSARDKYQQAQSAHGELFAADNLIARLNEVNGLLARGGRAGNAGAGAGGNTGAAAAGGTGPVASGGTGTAAGGTGVTTAGGNAGAANSTGRGTAVDQKAVEAQRLAKSAKEYLSQGKYAEADREYASLLKVEPKSQEAADAIAKSTRFKELKGRSTQLQRSGNNSGAQQALLEARGIDPERFNREGLAAILDKLTPASSEAADRARSALQQGLVALLNGRAEDSIAILEPALARADKSASLHAYLGVAYATQALSTPKAEDRSRLEDKAIEQFKLAKSAQADYQLSPRIVSPAIVSIYQNARP